MCKKVSIFINKIACFRRMLDAKTLHNKYFNNHEVKIVPNEEIEKANFAIIVTCAFHEEAVEYSTDLIEYVRQFIPEEKILVMGCLPPITPSLLKKSKHYTIAPKNYGKIDNIFLEMGLITKKPEISFIKLNTGSPELSHKSAKLSNKSYYINVAEGCSGKCSYCVIKKAIGKTNSRRIEDIEQEVENALDLGYTSIYPGSDDLGAYGIDIDETFPNLLESIINISKYKQCDSFRIELRNIIHPKWTVKYYNEIIQLLTKYKKIFPVYTCALQSGNERILTLCNRYSDVKNISKIFHEIRHARNDIYMFGHLIVGLPSESIEELLDSINYILDSPINLWTCFKYSINPISMLSKMKINWSDSHVNNNWNYFINIMKQSSPYIKEENNRVYIANSINSDFVDISFN